MPNKQRKHTAYSVITIIMIHKLVTEVNGDFFGQASLKKNRSLLP